MSLPKVNYTVLLLFSLYLSNSLLHLYLIIEIITIMTSISFDDKVHLIMSTFLFVVRIYQLFELWFLLQLCTLSLVQISFNEYIHSWRCTLYRICGLAVNTAHFRRVNLCSSHQGGIQTSLSMQRKMNESLFWFWKLLYALHLLYSLFCRLMLSLKHWNCENQQNARAIVLCSIIWCWPLLVHTKYKGVHQV